MAAISTKTLAARRKAAQGEKQQFQPLLDDAYEFAIPYRKGISETGAGEKRTNRVYDHTLIVSTFRSASRVAQDISPPGQQNFEIQPGPLAKVAMQPAELEALKAEIEPIKAIVNAHFSTGEWDTALQELAIDLMAGTGCMLIVPDKRTRMSRFIAVPLEEVLITSGPYNTVNGIFWERKWSLRQIAEDFGMDKFSTELAKAYAENPEKEICLYQDTVWEPNEGRWCRVAWSMDNVGANNQPVAFERSYSRACPWLTPRYFRVPGETYGRGPVMLVMPTAKALNTATKLNLQAAAIAMLGIYTAIDDGVFNPKNAPITPGAFWKVARNGGVLGPSVQRFPDPRVDLSQIILKELRMDVQQGMNDQSLPPDSAAVKSATEIIERVKRMASDHMGAFGRLIMEIAVPAVQRVMEIAYEFKQFSTNLSIDRLMIDLMVSSPMAMAQEAARVQRIVQYLEMVIMLAPAIGVKPARYAHFDKVLPDIASSMAVPPRYVPTEEERKAMDDQDAQAQAAMAAGAVATQDPKMLETAMAA